MSKPRLAEILGVEVGEIFRVKDVDDAAYYVSEHGYLYYGDRNTGSINAVVLCGMISDPGSIIHNPKWTEQDIEDAKAVKRLMPLAHIIGRDHFGAVYVVNNSEDVLIDTSCFFGIKRDEEIELDEILNEVSVE